MIRHQRGIAPPQSLFRDAVVGRSHKYIGGSRRGLQKDSSGSVEKVLLTENHDVVGKGHQSQVALLTPIASDVGTLSRFDHRFDLQALLVR